MTLKIFDIKSPAENVRAGYMRAAAILADKRFYELVLDQRQYTYTNHNPIEVGYRLLSCLEDLKTGAIAPITVKEYWYGSKSVIATTGLREDPEAIFVNTNGMSARSDKDYFLNALHEFGHKPMGHSHGSNFPPGDWRGFALGDLADKNLSVPHSLATIGLAVAIEKGLYAVPELVCYRNWKTMWRRRCYRPKDVLARDGLELI